MTGSIASSFGAFPNSNMYKNQEWLNRRKLRIEQVRKQSKAIAKALRQKVENEEKLRVKKHEKIEEAKFKCWKAEKLDEMERQLRYALEEFGLGHKLAVVDPCIDNIIDARNKANMWKAQKRGEIATEEEQRMKKLEEQKALNPIQRKQMTRKFEDLRSALVRSVSAKKQWLDNWDGNYNKNEDVKKPEKSLNKRIYGLKEKIRPIPSEQCFLPSPKKVVPQPLTTKVYEDVCVEATKPLSKKPETIWIDLNDINDSSSVNSKSRSSKRVGGELKIPEEKPTSVVEFYDYNSRYNCRSFREYPNLVVKLDPTPTLKGETIKVEETVKEQDKLEAEKRERNLIACQERGNKALQREKIKQDYNKLIAKLDDLNKKEKMIKTHQQMPSTLIYMNDDRLSEKKKIKQQIMNSKFESIYYRTTCEMPVEKCRNESAFELEEEGSCPSDREAPTRLGFSPSNLKRNSPVNGDDEPEEPERCSVQSSPMQAAGPMKKKKRKLKKKLLLDIDRALKEGRMLREAITCNLEKSCGQSSNTDNESSEKSTDGGMEAITEVGTWDTNCANEPVQEKGKRYQNQESQTDEYTHTVEDKNEEVPECADGNDSVAISTSTSYKSPPSVLSCGLENYHGSEDSMRRRKVQALNKVFHSNDFYKNKTRDGSGCALEYYITRLLNMSREHVANLSISSENVSAVNTNASDNENCSMDHSETESASQSYSKESPNSVRETCQIHNPSRIIHRPSPVENSKTVLDMLIKEPKVQVLNKSHESVMSEICERNIGNKYFSEKNVEPEMNSTEPDGRESFDGPTSHNYDVITEKCSKRITELTDLLSRVRRDKEILLQNSTSGTSCWSFDSEKKKLDKVLEEDMDTSSKGHVQSRFQKVQSVDGKKRNSSTVTAVDSESVNELDETVASTDTTFPDVMNVLLKKKIISSPFKWGDGQRDKDEGQRQQSHRHRQRDDPQNSIEAAIGNFRRRMKNIKPFTIASPGKASIFSDLRDFKCPDPLNDDDDDVESNLLGIEGISEVDGAKGEKAVKSVYSTINESSTDSINYALTNLGLDWAKSFLRKNKESKAISSSSSSRSDEKNSTDDIEYYNYIP